MLRSILFVVLIALILGFGLKFLQSMTPFARGQVFRGFIFWTAMAGIAVVISFIIAVSF